MRVLSRLSAPGRDAFVWDEEQARSIEVAFAVVAALAVGLRLQLPLSLTPAIVVGAMLLPVWVPALDRWVLARSLATLVLVALLNGAFLAGLAANSFTVDLSESFAIAFLVLSIFVGAGVLLWTRQVIGTAPTAILFALGAIATVPRGNASVIANPWKFGYSVPVTILVLGLAFWTSKWLLELVALGILSMVGMLNDSRSYFAMLLVAAVIITWQRIAKNLAGQSLFFSGFGLVVGAVGVYVAATRLASSGVLGAAAAQRTEAQIQAGGSLILGGRPELSATVALMKDRVWGFGLGRMPTLHDLAIAKSGMAEAGYDPNNGYVERYMFGSGFEVHSLFGDFWIHLGVFGLVLIAFCVVLAISAMVRGIRKAEVSALGAFLAISLVWNTGFSPLYSSIGVTTIGLGLLLWQAGEPRNESVVQDDRADSTPVA